MNEETEKKYVENVEECPLGDDQLFAAGIHGGKVKEENLSKCEHTITKSSFSSMPYSCKKCGHLFKITSCPFCGVAPDYAETVFCSNWNHVTDETGELKNRKAERIDCNNVRGCRVRPKLLRVETGDAIEVWNTRFTG